MIPKTLTTNVRKCSLGDYDAQILGNNEYGQLGLGKKATRLEPTEIDINSKLKDGAHIAKLKCDSFHTILLTNKGRWLVTGLNDFGQLGLGDNDNKHRFEELEMPLRRPERFTISDKSLISEKQWNCNNRDDPTTKTKKCALQ